MDKEKHHFYMMQLSDREDEEKKTREMERYKVEAESEIERMRGKALSRSVSCKRKAEVLHYTEMGLKEGEYAETVARIESARFLAQAIGEFKGKNLVLGDKDVLNSIA